MKRARSFVNWQRLAVALPFLIALGVAVFIYLPGRGNNATPRAVLAETPPGPGANIGVKKGDVARDFVGQAPDGTQIRLSDLRGKPTVINFWATWCTSCLAELPDLKAVQQQVGADKLNVLAVNAGEDSGAATNFLNDLKAKDFHVSMDPTLVVADAYGVFGLPQSFFIDAQGVIRAIYTGQLSKDLMQQDVRAATSGANGADAPPKVRLITTVARDHTLVVHQLGAGVVELLSKGLRCDDTYCATPVIDALQRNGAVRSIARYISEDPPRIVVTFDPSRTSADAMASQLADALRALHDPLYERPLEIVKK